MIGLREISPDDARAVQRIYRGASVAFVRPREMTAEDAEAYVAEAVAHARAVPRRRWCLGITLDGDDLIGLVKFRHRGDGHADLSYILREDTWGRGYATAAVRQAVAHAFGSAGMVSLSARHHPDNPASGRVLAKAGFVRTGTTPDGPPHGRAGVDFPVYEIHSAAAEFPCAPPPSP